jgi:hypothetical protein
MMNEPQRMGWDKENMSGAGRRTKAESGGGEGDKPPELVPELGHGILLS